MTDKKHKNSKFTTIARQIAGVGASIGMWWVDVEHKITEHSFPLVSYILPVGAAMGWDLHKLVVTATKGTKFEGMFDDDRDKEIPSRILKVAIEHNIPLDIVKAALDDRMTEADLIDLMEDSPKKLIDIYEKEISKLSLDNDDG